ncbi:MAG: transposase [Firmicutes bacterium]|nr:transposase [Bacillota bacterium]
MNTLLNFILTLKLDTEKYQEDILVKRLEISRNIYNGCLGELYKRYNHMKDSKKYQKIVKLSKGKERNKKFRELNKKYGLTEYSLHEYVKGMQKHFKKNIDSFTAQKIATRSFIAFKKLMFHQANKVYFKKYGEMNSVEGKSNKTGIRFKDNKLIWNKLKIPVIIKKNDEYAHMALENKIKYCRIVRKFIRGKYKFYIQLILDGIPPIKINKKTGEIKNSISRGDVGIDIGTQTIAISSQYDVKLLELAPEVKIIEKERRKLLRKLDRQRRSNNPNNYNKDGTIRKGVKLRWNNSNRYIKTKNRLKEVQRKQAVIRKQSHEKLANYILSLGNRFLVENMNYKGLQAKAKKTTINEKTMKYNKKKRFGKSLANKAPAMFLTILDNKLKWHDKNLLEIDTYKVKASQYNHIENKYIKKKISDRWNDFGELKIQRDLYSAFIIQNVIGKNLNKIDREKMINTFDNFKKLHDKEIERVKNSKSKLIASMGI